MTFDTALETLSDDAAVERLYTLAASGNDDPAELARLDALVYSRLMRAYGPEAEDRAA